MLWCNTGYLLKEIKTSCYYILILDKATNVSNKEQLSFWLSFTDMVDDIRGEFLKFIFCDISVTGKDLFETVEKTFSESWFELINYINLLMGIF